jgi:sulfhydrogenase subunit gamma (sulfur reductase)
MSQNPNLSPLVANPYLPDIGTIIETIQETHNIMTFRVVLDNQERMQSFHYEPGQVGQLSIFGVGESTFVINSPPTRREYLQFSVMRAGEVTAKLHKLSTGDRIGVRAPLGNFFPYESMKGKDILFIGGGIGMAPLRTLLLFMLDNREDYGKIRVLYGARSPQDMAFSYELPEWLERGDLETVLTIDQEAEGWNHKVGLIPNVLLEMAPEADNGVAVTCGPPIMIKFTIQALKKLGFKDNQIVTTLEKRMKCGIGICGRCNIGTKYVCVDGPVFTYEELRQLPNEL